MVSLSNGAFSAQTHTGRSHEMPYFTGFPVSPILCRPSRNISIDRNVRDNAHLFAFYLRPPGSRSKRFRNWDELDLESDVPLEAMLVKRSDELIYEYDFGDSWIHSIKVEKRLTSSERVMVPRCTAGEGSCPPEDCGGIGGYRYLLEVIANEGHPRRGEMLQWVGGEFAPKRFDCAQINNRIERLWSANA